MPLLPIDGQVCSGRPTQSSKHVTVDGGVRNKGSLYMLGIAKGSDGRHTCAWRRPHKRQNRQTQPTLCAGRPRTRLMPNISWPYGHTQRELCTPPCLVSAHQKALASPSAVHTLGLAMGASTPPERRHTWTAPDGMPDGLAHICKPLVARPHRDNGVGRHWEHTGKRRQVRASLWAQNTN